MLFPLNKAIESVLGHRPHIQTSRRWIKKGVRGIKLEATFICGQYLTTTANVERFMEALTQARLSTPSGEILSGTTEPVRPAAVVRAVGQFERIKATVSKRK